MILNVGGFGYQMADIQFDDINYFEGASCNGWKAYSQTKSAQLLGTRAWTLRLKDRGIAVLIAHLGSMFHVPTCGLTATNIFVK
ncbi:hypothetical protein BS50DRAFT_656366 [Corynespora cassiicola Philippines]|uniref:Uncharacterized protein n=1 Tax=Corynespora cassiicola Philippines TaxID=1448308 RepID=A0A2T2N519_CORCC|nr:hypothetical protein BS50DRAFT_656366 [Corynespora cassiicola Philippines]